MVACKTETEPVVEKEDVIALSDLQINLGSNLKVESTISAQTIRQGISANLSINDGEKQRKNLEELFNEFKDKKAVTITITNNDETVYSITNKGLPTNGYTFTKEENNFKVSVNIGDASFSFSKAFSVAPKEQGGSEEGQGSTPTVTEDPAPETPEYIVSVSYSTALESYQEEDDTDLLKELRIAVVFDGDEYSSHTKTFNLEELYGWLSDTDRYFAFELYADNDETEEPLYSFSKGWFRETSGILLNAEGAYSYRCTLRIMIYWGEEFSGDFSVNILPETGTPITIRSAALLWNLNANALPSPPQEVTLTASLIKVLGDATSGKLARFKTEERLASNLDAARAHYGIDITDATAAASALAACIGGSVVVEKNGDITLPFYRYDGFPTEDKKVPQYVISNDKAISLEGNFYYTDMALYISNLTNVNVDNATFSMGEDNGNYEVYVDMIESLYKGLNPNVTLDSDEILRSNEDNNFNDYKTPKLGFNLSDILYYSDEFKNLTSLYKIYDKKGKLNNIQVSLSYDVQTLHFNGKKEEEETLLFDKDGNLNLNVPNISVNVLLKLAKLNADDAPIELKNLVITGDYKETKNESVDINSELTNVVFTGDVSGLKNSGNYQFNGVVYFMDKPYNNRKGDSVGPLINGIVKLDKLEGVSYDTFRVIYGVLDLRGRDDLDHNPLEGYNIETESEKAINHSGHRAIYFTTKYVDNIEGINANLSIEEKFETLTRRVQRVGQGGEGVYNVYVDNDKYDSIADKISTLYYEHHAFSKTPRSLEEFEYYGNSLDMHYENGKFKTSAYDSYNDDFDGVHPDIIEILKEDKDSGNYCIP